MAIDIVIPLGTGSRWRNREIMYSLRSLEKYGNNVGNIFILGSMPSNLQGCIHVPYADEDFPHETSIMRKFLHASKMDRVSENFLMWNDDYFLTDNIDCENYPNYYHMTISERIRGRRIGDGYRTSMENCLSVLKKEGKPELFYDIHCPMIYNKSKFIEIMERYSWKVSNGYIIKSLYQNQQPDNNPVIMPDLKLYSNLINVQDYYKEIRNRHIFSISDNAITRNFEKFIHELFPNKSKYEL